MASKFLVVNAFTCERVLIEQDKVLSLVRLIDVFNIPANAPPNPVIQFWLVILAKWPLPPPSEAVQFNITLIHTSGEREILTPPAPMRVPSDADPTIPAGLAIVSQINMSLKSFGTFYLEIDADGEILAKIPVTAKREDQVLLAN